MSLSLVKRGNQHRMVRSIPQLQSILERETQLVTKIQAGLDYITPAEMIEFLKSQIAELEPVV